MSRRRSSFQPGPVAALEDRVVLSPVAPVAVPVATPPAAMMPGDFARAMDRIEAAFSAYQGKTDGLDVLGGLASTIFSDPGGTNSSPGSSKADRGDGQALIANLYNAVSRVPYGHINIDCVFQTTLNFTTLSPDEAQHAQDVVEVSLRRDVVQGIRSGSIVVTTGHPNRR